VAAWNDLKVNIAGVYQTSRIASAAGVQPAERGRSVSGGRQRLQPAPAGSNAGERPSEPSGRPGRGMHRPQGRSCSAVQAKPRTAAPRFVRLPLEALFRSNTCHSTASRDRNRGSLKRRDSTRVSPIVFTRARGASNGDASRFFGSHRKLTETSQGTLRAHGSQDLQLAVGGPAPGIRPAWLAPLIPSTLTEARRWSRYDLPP
jgi:hypothetical protein